MRRGAKLPKARIEAKIPAARKSRKNNDPRVRGLEKRLAEALGREAEALKHETEALERETATSEILRIISSSPTAVQPVFGAVAVSAARLCDAYDAAIFLVDGDVLRLTAHDGPIPAHPLGQGPPLVRGTPPGRAVLDRQTIHVLDMQAELAEYPEGSAIARRFGHRTVLIVPLLRAGEALGAIALRRTEVRPFTDSQVALLQTFAEQAVIAIENVRLFNETKEALERQTATAEILRVISSSPTDVQPVFDAIVANAARLCDADFSAVTRFEGGLLHLVAVNNMSPAETTAYHTVFPRPPGRHFVVGRAFVDARPVHVEDIEADPDYDPRTREILGRAARYRTFLGVPILRDGVPIGAIGCGRHEMKPFTATQIELVKTFADQAVIAIENVRLFTELQEKNHALTQAHARVNEALEQQTATSEVLRVISSSPTDVQPVFDAIAAAATTLCAAENAGVFLFDGTLIHFAAHHRWTAKDLDAIREAFPRPPGPGTVTARAILTRAVAHTTDIATDPGYELRGFLAEGFHAILSVPMLRDGEPIGAISVTRREAVPFTHSQIALLQTFADQAVIAIENVRLFKELQARNRDIEDKSRQLETASQHKSEFLANMSHELRTPLNAVIGFSEVLAEGMFGEVNEKQTEYLRDILESGQHLLSLINDILDLSKVEAGRMELELTAFDLPQAISNALTLVRGRAARRNITLHQAVDQRLGQIRGDERKIKQVLLNLLSNALKFTPEGGRVEVRASVVDGMAEISVADTGVGIAPEDQETVFEEFRQVGTADKKVEGTGLGLALSRKFIELHGGRIWVKSQVGVGSTFTFTLQLTI